MATVTANATASLSANGNSTATGSISWTRPSIPADATINSVRISGTWAWNGRGSISYVTINGTQTSDSVAFDIALSNSVTSPLSITCRGGNKNATGSNFSWSGLTVTYDYSLPATETLHFKQNGAWVAATAVYKKVNGTWVEQSDLSNVFDPETNYVKG